MKASEAQKVRERLEDIQAGEIFGYEEFEINSGNKAAVAKALSRLAKEGKICRASKGKYYKPKRSKFGVKRPSGKEVLKLFLKDGSRTIGYVTGNALYNRLGISSQMSNVIEIATEKPRSNKEVEGYKLKFVKSSVPVTKSKIPYLQLLDVFKNVNNIPGVSPNDAFKQLTAKLISLKQAERVELVNVAKGYNPATRALLGAALEKYCGDLQNSQKLLQTLNIYSTYNFQINDRLLPNKSKWKIL